MAQPTADLGELTERIRSADRRWREATEGGMPDQAAIEWAYLALLHREVATYQQPAKAAT